MSESAAPESVLDRIVARTRRLYSLPVVAARVLELTSQEHIDPRAIKECIENDPGLTAKILRVANSSLFGLRTEVANLNQAIGLLGIRSLKMLVLGFSLPSELTRQVPSAVLQRFWQQTVYRAVAARRFAQQFWQLPSDDLFLAGLLEGVGLLALIQDLGENYTLFLDHVYNHGGDLSEQELAVLGFDHAVLSARMLEHWGLPESLVKGVGRPRQMSRLLALPAGEQSIAGVLHLSDLAAEFLVTARPAKLQTLLHAAGQLKNLSSNDVRTVMCELEDEAAQLAELFKIAPPEAGAFARMFTQAQASLADLTESVLLDGQEDDRQLVDVLQQASELRQDLSRAVAAMARRGDTEQPTRRSDGPRADRRPPVVKPRRVGGETALLAHVAAAVERCRGQRCPLSLAMVAVDDYSDVLLEVGLDEVEHFVHWLSRTCKSLVADPDGVVAAGEARFAVLLEDHDRSAAASAGRQLLDAARRRSRSSIAGSARAIRISLGVATLALPPRNFSERDLLEAARRCLQAAHTSGGDSVKSIEI